MDTSAALAFAIDGATAVAGSFNTAWLAQHWLRGAQRGRRLAAITLAMLNAGIAAQAAFAQALYTSHRFGGPVDPFFSPAPWLASRALLLAGTLLLSTLILRKAQR
jgi:hypothetical protein